MSNGKPRTSIACLLAVSILCVQLVVSRSQPSTSNETGLFSDLWNSLTTVGKTSSCPGECLHAITSIFCDNVLEEISCGEPHLRCCANSQISLASPSETSTPILSTEPTTETFSVISNNHNSSLTTTQSTSDLLVTIGTTSAWTEEQATTTAVSTDLHYLNSANNETTSEYNRNSFTACPVQCSKPSTNAFCIKSVQNTFCTNTGEECCLESEFTVDSMTKNLIKLVQQSVAKNETKNIGSELNAIALLNTTASPLPSCNGTCVISLFSILCDETDNTQFCPNGGSCCVNREQTTAAPTIGPCEGTCIPVILSGMCNKPYELVLKTIDCASSTICCADKKLDSSDDYNVDDPIKDAPVEPDKVFVAQPQFTGRPIIRHPQHPPTQQLPPNIPNQFNYKPNPFLVNPNPVPIPPMHPKPKPSFGHRNKPTSLPFHPSPVQGQVLDQPYNVPHLVPDLNNNKVHMRPQLENVDSKPIEDKKPQQIPINKKFACPGNCMSSMFRFACFGTNSIYTGFYCPKGQVCCVPYGEIEKFETFLQSSSVHQSPPPSPPPVLPEPTVSIINPVLSHTESSIESTNPEPSPHVCGVKGARRSKRVVGGSDSYPGEWCWQIALVNQQNKYICGGALIGKQWVLTAAHCITNLVRKNEPIFVRVGEYDLTRNKKIGVKVSTSYIHHNHNGQSLDNDIALLKLQLPVELNSDICLVCLPTRNTKRDPGKRCTVTGYGFEHESGPIALRIRQASVPIVEDQECTARINSVTERLFILPASSFCAGGEGGNDACQGDGGSGLVCHSDDFYELTGLVSWGFGCGRNGVPGVYVKVSSFVGWINQIVSTNSN